MITKNAISYSSKFIKTNNLIKLFNLKIDRELKVGKNAKKCQIKEKYDFFF